MIYFARVSLSPINPILLSIVPMSSSSSVHSASDASSESVSSRSAEIECKYSLIPLDVIHSLILISELHVLFERHLKLAKSKETSREAKRAAENILDRTKALIDPLLGARDQKNAINTFKRFLGHKNEEMVLKAFEYIDQGHFDALVCGSSMCGD